jgi:hypothetical protein
VTNSLDEARNGFSTRGLEPNRSSAVEVTPKHFTDEGRTISLETHVRTGLELLPGVHQRFPHLGGSLGTRLGIQCANFQAANQQTLNGPATRHAMTEQSRGKHARVIDDDQIATIQMQWQLREHRVVCLFRRPIEDDEA